MVYKHSRWKGRSALGSWGMKHHTPFTNIYKWERAWQRGRAFKSEGARQGCGLEAGRECLVCACSYQIKAWRIHGVYHGVKTCPGFSSRMLSLITLVSEDTGKGFSQREAVWNDPGTFLYKSILEDVKCPQGSRRRAGMAWGLAWLMYLSATESQGLCLQQAQCVSMGNSCAKWWSWSW